MQFLTSGFLIYGLFIGVAFLLLLFFLFLLQKRQRRTDGLHSEIQTALDQASDLDNQISQLGNVLNTHRGLVFVWKPEALDKEKEGTLKVFGSSLVLAKFLRIADQGQHSDPALRIFENLLTFPAESEEGQSVSLKKQIKTLKTDGEPFSSVLTPPSGKKIMINGITTGIQPVVWASEIFIPEKTPFFNSRQLKKVQETYGESLPSTLQIFERIGLPFWCTDRKGALLWTNSDYVQAVQAHGLSEVLQDQIPLLPNPEIFLSAIKKSSNNQYRQSLYVSIKGERRYLDCLAILDQDLIFFFAFDQTQEQSAQNALERQEEAHDAVLNHLNEAALVFGSDKKLIFYNKAFLNMFHYKPEDLEGRPSHEDILDRLREARQLPEQENYERWKAEEMQRYEQNLEEQPDELWALPDGRTLRLAPMYHPMGGLMTLFEDITDHVGLKARYNALIEVQKATLDKLNEGVVVFGSEGRLKLHNKALESIWKFSGETPEKDMEFDHFTKICSKLYHNPDFWQALKVRITDPSPEVRQHVSDEIQTADDRSLYYFSRPLPDGATIIGWDDITQTRQVENALRERAEALEAAGKVKSNFIGHMSYHLRSPLQTILGYSDFLIRNTELASQLEPKAGMSPHRPLESIREAAQTLAKIIDDILDIAAIEAEAIEIEWNEINLYEVLKDSLAYVTTTAEQSHLSFTLKCDENIGKVYADKKRLKQILHNLLLNAVSFTPKNTGGEIILGAKRKEGEFSVWVKDSGIGISSEKQGKVFESFVSEQGGAGLGLALVRHFVELHHGWVELESETGKGACILCHFPDRSQQQIEELACRQQTG